MKKNRKGKEEERTFESEIERNVKSGKKDGNSRMTNENHQILRRKSKIQRLKIKYKKKIQGNLTNVTDFFLKKIKLIFTENCSVNSIRLLLFSIENVCIANATVE